MLENITSNILRHITKCGAYRYKIDNKITCYRLVKNNRVICKIEYDIYNDYNWELQILLKKYAYAGQYS